MFIIVLVAAIAFAGFMVHTIKDNNESMHQYECHKAEIDVLLGDIEEVPEDC
ncbi:hypothetical protein ACTXK0_05195 [Corynebacterium variabile]|uniref:hypothetical protein n=1 Tax=Corynebacterium variabile TaxID=1727 RepID=UPI003FD0A1EF